MYDIIVIGAGHAGIEAALAGARMKQSVLLITSDLSSIGKMPCNPAIGGIAKGQIVREIDALGGEMGKAIDATAIQFKLLNRSKGAAMHSPRAQADKNSYSIYMRQVLENEERIHFMQDTVTEIINENGCFSGVALLTSGIQSARSGIVCTGTFINGLIHIGEKSYPGGQMITSPPVSEIGNSLIESGFVTRRLKTGTPPRIDSRSVDLERLEEQPGDLKPVFFSYSNLNKSIQKQKSCFLAHTNTRTHEILKLGFGRSPLFNGRIEGAGPRYCPSIEDKLNRFSDRNSHHLFLEPEGWKTNEMYVNGFSTSLPTDIQTEALRTVEGLEQAIMIRPGYAIEYDFFPPHQIYNTLETKRIKNLFFAGQINGTSGYEEAAAQGLIAGINAALHNNGKSSLVLNRRSSYIGVLLDDLTTKEIIEPYRMFTSSAENRLFLRYDNADIRLRNSGWSCGLVNNEDAAKTAAKAAESNILTSMLRDFLITDQEYSFLNIDRSQNSNKQSLRAAQLLKRQGVTIEGLKNALPRLKYEIQAITRSREVEENTETEIKYEGYVGREQQLQDKISRLENLRLVTSLDYKAIKGLSNEGREKLLKNRPENLGQASRIPGVSPTDIAILLVYMKR